MSNVTFLDVVRISRETESIEDLLAPTVYVREMRVGLWIVHDELDRKGGCFRDRAAAFRFIDDAFGEDARTVIYPHFTTPAERGFADVPVAQRAVTLQ